MKRIASGYLIFAILVLALAGVAAASASTPTTNLLISSPNPSTFGQPVALKDTITGTVPDGGKVYFILDGATIDSANIDGTGVASVTTSVMRAGSHAVVAFYGGTSNFDTSTSNTVIHTVNQAGATATLTSSLNPSTFGQSVTFKAKVDNASNTPTGSVTFYNGASSLGSFPLAGDSALVSSAALTAGSHTIKAVYGGDGNFKSDSATVVQSVNLATPAVMLTSSLNPSTFEQAVTFKAKVDYANNTPTGNVTFFDGVFSLGNFVLTGDSAQVSTSATTAGGHIIKAVYGGDSNFKSDTATIVQAVNQAKPVVVLTSGLNPALLDQPVTLKVKVGGQSFGATGGVTFYDGATSLGSFLLAGDSAEVSTANLTVGGHIIRVIYGGDGNFKGDSAAFIQAINQGKPTNTLTSNHNPSSFEANVTFTAKVDNPNHTPTGSVVFSDGASSLGSFLLTGDSASVSTTALTAGIHTITAVYSGDANFISDTSTIVQTVNQAGLTLTLMSGQNPSIFGQYITFKVTAAGVSHTPRGSVTFFDGATLLGNYALLGEIAQMSSATLIVGSHSIKAVYSGDGNFNPDSTVITQTVNQATAAMTLVSSLNPSTFEQSVMFKVKVDNPSQPPTGTITFYDGGASMGSFALTGDSAEVSSAALTGGSHIIKAVYSGDTTFNADSTTLTQVVNPAAPTLALTSSLNPSAFEQNVTLKLKVDNSSTTPTGGVTFYDGVALLWTVQLTRDSAQVSTSALTTGSHTIKAVYGGDDNFNANSATILQTVLQSKPAIVLTSSLNPSTFEQSVTFKAKVDAQSHTPTGSISFYDGASLLGNFVLIGDSAQVSTAALPVGSRLIKVVYSGDGDFNTDSTTIIQTVIRAAPAVTLTASPSPSGFGQSVTFKARVDGQSHLPTGDVTFFDGAISLGTVPLARDSAQMSTSSLAAGNHTIKVVYGGDGSFKPDSASTGHSVNQSGLNMTLTSSPNPSTFAQNVILKVKVDALSQQPTGSVTFYDGASPLASFTLAGDSAQASTTNLTGGVHTLMVVYGGDGNFSPDSATMTQTVNRTDPAVTLTSSVNPSIFEQSVTFKSKVDFPGHTPTGNVTFYDGPVSLGTVPLTRDSSSVNIGTLSGGIHAIVAVYGGDGDFKSDSATITQTVNREPTTTLLTTSPNPSVGGQSVTFRDSVLGSVPDGGKVYFSVDGAVTDSALINGSGVATVSTTTLSTGSHSISARYSGTTNFDTSSSNTVAQAVGKTPTTSKLIASPNPSVFGQSVVFSDTVKRGANAGQVHFKVDGTLVDSAVVNGSGIALVSRPNLAIGTHAIVAHYNGTSSFDTSTSNIVSLLVKPDSFTIASSAGLHGTINPSRTARVARGADRSFIITPIGDYHVDSVIVDGSRVDSTTSYTFRNVSANHTIRSTFAQNTYVINATGGPNGTIVPFGAITVLAGASQTFAITGNTLYRVADVLVDGASVGRVTNYTFTNVESNHTIAASYEPSPEYSASYRSFGADSIAFSRDNRGKLGKYVVRTPDKVDFQFIVRPDSSGVDQLYVEFSIPIDTFQPLVTIPSSTKSMADTKSRKWIFTFDRPLSRGDTVTVSGFGNKGKVQKVSKYNWRKNARLSGISRRTPFFVRNEPKLPLPNRINVLAEEFALSGFASTKGLLVGRDRSQDSSTQYGWLLSPKYTNVVSTLLDKSGPHAGAPRGFDRLKTGGAIVKRQTQLPPGRFDDVLLADIIALKIGIVASQLQKTPLGFGELVYNDGTANSLNGLMIKQIARVADSLMMGYYHFGAHEFYSAATYLNLDSTIRNINMAFEGPLDTMKFSDSLKIKGVRSLMEVSFLRSNAHAAPEKITPVQVFNVDVPARYQLRQNYPNPFNPTTTIEFQVTYPAVITLTVYNTLGQKIATLIDNQLMDDGEKTAQFDGSNLPSGVYFYRIVAEQPANEDEGIGTDYFRSTRKMLLIK